MTEPPELPAFTRAFPRDPRLEPLVRAFARGDYARLRRDAPPLASGDAPADVKAAAEDLLRRTRPDPLMLFLLGVAGALLLALAGYWIAVGR